VSNFTPVCCCRDGALLYRHSGYGFLSSWGSADMVMELLEGALKAGAPADTISACSADRLFDNPGN